MSPAAIDVGSFSWAWIQRLYDADGVVHWQRCEAEGSPCPQDVFTQHVSCGGECSGPKALADFGPGSLRPAQTCYSSWYIFNI